AGRTGGTGRAGGAGGAGAGAGGAGGARGAEEAGGARWAGGAAAPGIALRPAIAGGTGRARRSRQVACAAADDAREGPARRDRARAIGDGGDLGAARLLEPRPADLGQRDDRKA